MVAQYISICLFYFLEINYIYKVKIIYDYYKKDAFEKRNKYLVDNADVIIAVYNPKYIRSGTGQTVRMAQRAGIEVIIINPQEYIKY